MRGCVVCGGVSGRLFARNGHDLLRCSACGHIFVGNPPDIEALSRFYRDCYVEDGAEILRWFERLARINADLIERWSGAGKKLRLLDVGSGTGSLLAEGQRRGWDCLGLEHSPQRLAITEAKGATARPLMLGEAEAELGRGSFGAITFFHVAEHFVDPVAEFEFAHRLLAAGGILLVNSPYMGSLAYKIGGRFWDWCIHCPEHLQFYSRRSLEVLFGGRFETLAFFTRTEAPPLYYHLLISFLNLAGALSRKAGFAGGRLSRLRQKFDGGRHYKLLEALYTRTPLLDSWLKRRDLGHEFVLILRKKPE